MPKFIAIADIHINPWTAFAKLNRQGVNTRLLSILKALRFVMDRAVEEKAYGLLIAGDLFHTTRIDAVTYDLTVRTLRKSPLPVVIIPGNHDEASKMEEFHSLRAMNGLGEVVRVLDERDGMECNLGGVRIAGIPFQAYNEVLKARLKKVDTDILLLHTGFANAVAGADYIADQKEFIKTSTIRKLASFGVAVAGHFHQPQVYLENSDTPVQIHREVRYSMNDETVLIPGSPVQHNFGDVGSQRGYWVLDTGKKMMGFKPLNWPCFIKTDLTEKQDPERWLKFFKGNYVSVTVGSKEDVEPLKEYLEENSEGYTIQVRSRVHSKRRMKIDLEMERTHLLKLFIKTRTGSKDKSLYKVGKRLLAKAEQELVQ